MYKKLSTEYKNYAMDNMSCIDFLLLIYNWILEDFEEQNQPQPVYIEMQPLAPRIYPAESAQIAKPEAPLMRQRKHVCFESPEIPTTNSETPSIVEHETKQTPIQTQEDVFETDFEIIEIADVIAKED